MRLCSASGLHFWERRTPKHILNCLGILGTLVLGFLIYRNLTSPKSELPPAVRTQLYESARTIAAQANEEVPVIAGEIDAFVVRAEESGDRPTAGDSNIEQIIVSLEAFLGRWETIISRHTDNILSKAAEHRLKLDVTAIESQLRKELGRISNEDLQKKAAAPKQMGMFPGLDSWVLSSLVKQASPEADKAERQANAEARSNRPAARIATALERIIANLLRVRNQVRNPRARQAIDASILRIRNLGRLFDFQAPTLTVTLSPQRNTYGTADFPILVTVNAKDELSGLDVTSLRIEAVVDGTIIPLSPSISNTNPVAATLTATATITRELIPDGAVRVVALIADNAGNQGQGESPSFVKDTTPPSIQIHSPLDGTTSYGTTVRVLIAWSDTLSSIDQSSIEILMDGSIHSGLQAAKTATGVDLPIVLQLGRHVLEVRVRDALGNSAAVQSTFVLADPRLRELRLEMVSGDGQSALTGRCIENPLVVRVTDGLGNPKSGILIQYEGDGFALPASGLDHVTNQDGHAGVLYRIPAVIGSVSVRASVTIAGRHILVPDTQVAPPPLTFTIESKAAGIAIISPFSESGPLTIIEYPGSALPHLITIQAMREDGVPVRKELIVGRAFTIAGDPIALGSAALLHPSHRLTDDNGMATFAIEISAATVASEFLIRFALPGFYDEDGEEVQSQPIHVKIGDPAHRTASIVSGQGQITYAGEQTAAELVAFTPVGGGGVEDGGGIGAFSFFFEFGGTIRFTILAGEGSLEAGSIGTPVLSTQDANGKTTMILMQTNPFGLASVKYQKGPGAVPDLVGISGGGGIIATDVFVISIPEIRFANAADPLRDAAAAYPYEDYLQNNPPDLAFRIELRLPADNSLTPLGSIASLDSCRAPVNQEGTVGNLSKADLAFSRTATTPRFSSYLSTESFIASRTHVEEGEDQPQVPDGFTAVHIDPRGSIQAAFAAGATGDLSPYLQDGELARPAQIVKRGGTLVYSVPEVQNDSLENMSFKFKINRGGNEVILTKRTGKRASIAVMFVGSGDEPNGGNDEIENHSGEVRDPIRIQVAKSNANRRATISLEVSALKADNQTLVEGTQPIEGKIFVALDSRDVGTALTAEIKANPAAHIPEGFPYPGAEEFTLNPEAQIQIRDERNQPDALNTGFAKSRVKSLMQNVFLVPAGRERIASPLIFVPIDPANAEASTLVVPYVNRGATTMSNVFVVGTALYDQAGKADNEDFFNSIVFHERVHIRNGFALKSVVENTGTPIPVKENILHFVRVQRAAFDQLYGQLPAELRANEEARVEFSLAARKFIVLLDELQAYVEELNAAGRDDSQVSWAQCLSGLKQLSAHWAATCDVVKNGIKVTIGNDTYTLTLGGSVRTDVIAIIKGTYITYTDPFASGSTRSKAGTWNIADAYPQSNDSVIVIPKE